MQILRTAEITETRHGAEACRIALAIHALAEDSALACKTGVAGNGEGSALFREEFLGVVATLRPEKIVIAGQRIKCGAVGIAVTLQNALQRLARGALAV